MNCLPYLKFTYVYQYMSMERSDHNFYIFSILSGLSLHTVIYYFVSKVYNFPYFFRELLSESVKSLGQTTQKPSDV